MDEACYAKQKTRVLFLLKDGNNPNRYEDDNGYIYRDLYGSAMATTKDETSKTRLNTMWRYMCMFMRIIEEPDFQSEQCWNEKHGFDTDAMRPYLTHFAAVNIKKSAGKGINDRKYASYLKKAVENYYDLTKAEIALINPDIVICGGTFDCIKDQYNTAPKLLPNGKRYFIYENCVYLEYWHPSARFGYKEHFDRFKETYSQLREALPFQ